MFFHVILTKAPGAHQEKYTRKQISRRLDFWEAVQHTGLVGDTDDNGVVREGNSGRG